MDLSTSYMGFNLANPIVPSASPLSEELDGIKRMEDAGAAAVVLPSLFEEQLSRERLELFHHLTAGSRVDHDVDENSAAAVLAVPRAALALPPTQEPGGSDFRVEELPRLWVFRRPKRHRPA